VFRTLENFTGPCELQAIAVLSLLCPRLDYACTPNAHDPAPDRFRRNCRPGSTKARRPPGPGCSAQAAKSLAASRRHINQKIGDLLHGRFPLSKGARLLHPGPPTRPPPQTTRNNKPPPQSVRPPHWRRLGPERGKFAASHQALDLARHSGDPVDQAIAPHRVALADFIAARKKKPSTFSTRLCPIAPKRAATTKTEAIVLRSIGVVDMVEPVAARYRLSQSCPGHLSPHR